MTFSFHIALQMINLFEKRKCRYSKYEIIDFEINYHLMMK